MNYMRMVSFKKISKEEAISEIFFQEREAVLINEFDKKPSIYNFMVIEAIFQTAGRVAREYTDNKYGGIIVGFNEFKFKHNINLNKLIEIKAKLISYNEKLKSFFLEVSVYEEGKIILNKGTIIIKQDENISSHYLNNDLINI